MTPERKRGRTIPRAHPVAFHRRRWGLEHELADGSIWRETPSGWWLVRLPTALNRTALRQQIAAEESANAAAWAMPPARPARIHAYPPKERRFTCTRCGSAAFTASISDPTICLRCATRQRQIAVEVTQPAFVCQRCGRDTIAPAAQSPSICIQCDHTLAAAAD